MYVLTHTLTGQLSSSLPNFCGVINQVIFIKKSPVSTGLLIEENIEMYQKLGVIKHCIIILTWNG